jgi:Lamin Tail Domain/Abnormal spindle-like microcephaly-assoc'd, ASPM-SPD-2-Hydin
LTTGGSSLYFSPEMKSILSALAVITASAHGELVITEVMASSAHLATANANGDWWELTNTGTLEVDLTGYRWDDTPTSSSPTLSNFPAGTKIQPGESIIILDEPTANVATWRAAWGLPATVRVLDNTALTAVGLVEFSGLGATGDQVNVYGPFGTLEAKVVFGASVIGKSFGFQRDGTAIYGATSVAGELGAAASTLTPGDVGSPGDRNINFTSAPVAVAGISYSYTVTAVNPGAAAPLISATGLPPFISLTAGVAGSATLTSNRVLTPADNGDYLIRLSATSGALTTAQVFNLKVQVAVLSPEISVEQPAATNIADGGAQAFGSLAIGASTSLTFTIRNRGTANLTGLVASLDGQDSDEFSITTQPVAPVAFPTGSTTFTVKFSPLYIGSKVAMLRVVSNDIDESIYDITLTASAFATTPEIGITQPAGTNLADSVGNKNFGKVKIGKKGAAKIFTILNTGKADLTGIAITKKGKHTSNFIVTALTTTTIAPGTSATFKVTFKPSAKGARKAALQVKSNDADENPFDINVTGIGGK